MAVVVAVTMPACASFPAGNPPDAAWQMFFGVAASCALLCDGGRVILGLSFLIAWAAAPLVLLAAPLTVHVRLTATDRPSAARPFRWVLGMVGAVVELTLLTPWVMAVVSRQALFGGFHLLLAAYTGQWALLTLARLAPKAALSSSSATATVRA